MYRKIDPPQRMTCNDASAHYPESYILMRMDSVSLSDDIGTVFYVGDDYYELSSLAMTFDGPNDVMNNMSLWSVREGLHHQRSLGGLVVGE